MRARNARNMNVEKRGGRGRRSWKGDGDEFTHKHVDVRFWCGVFRESSGGEETVRGLVVDRSTIMCVKLFFLFYFKK